KSEGSVAPDAQTQLNLRLSARIMALLEADAQRCFRSNTKQVEAILTAYYEVGDVDLRDTKQAKAKVQGGGAGHKAFLRAAADIITEERADADGDHAEFLEEALGVVETEAEKYRA